ncbi:hypothetical protein HYS93_02280 [Candidatus Daviesbacteria bacterium]|nr:hypothetical protein [Candidatus Daviesbacteria bacterium]
MINRQRGQLVIIAFIILTLVLVLTVALLSGSLTVFQSSKYSTGTLQAINLAEAGVDKAVAALNASGGSFNPNPDTEVAIGGGTFTLNITSVDAGTKKIQATGYYPNKANAKNKKTIELTVSKGVGVSFNYGVQVGDGGLEMENSATVNGSVYSNGSITMSNSAKINGDAYVAGGVQPTPDQMWECTDPNCGDFVFGKNSGAELDIAQSFKPTQTAVINKVALKLKKFGSPSNITVRILGDSSGKPNKNDVKASGTLSANLVTSQYSFVEVGFTTSPQLSANTYYWIMLDTTANSSNYWSWSSDTTQGYTCSSTPPCLAKWSPNWQASSPVWNTINGDLGFKTFMGGVATSITGTNSPQITGDAHANTLTGLTIGKDAYYQVESSNTVSGQNCTNNTHCHPGSTDPVVLTMPISQANIDEWKQQAQDAGSLPTPDCNNQTVWGPGKYTGSISLANTCKETVKTPIWITGDLTMTNSTEFKLDSSYGSASGSIIVDNFINLQNSNKLLGSGTPGSYLVAISEFNSRDDPLDRKAITVSNSGNQGVLYSNLGSIHISNSNTLTEITGWELELENSVTVNYDQGLASSFFTSGPSGSYSVIKGSYQSK